MCGDRFLEEAALLACMDQAGEKLWIIPMTTGLVQPATECVVRMARIRLEIRVVLVRDREPGAQLERAAQCFLGASFDVRGTTHELSENAQGATQLGPCGGEARVELHAALIQISRLGELLVGPSERVRLEVEGIGSCVVRRVGGGRGSPQGKRKNIHDASGEIIL